MRPMGELISTELGLAVTAEAPVIARMSRDYIERGLEWRWRTPAILAMIRDADTVVLCARRKDDAGVHVGGFGIMQFGLETAHLNLLAVTPRLRRQGLAGQLLDWLETTADLAGIKHITLEVRAKNSGARAFYRTRGYQDLEYVPRYYSGREAAFRMRRKLR